MFVTLSAGAEGFVGGLTIFVACSVGGFQEWLRHSSTSLVVKLTVLLNHLFGIALEGRRHYTNSKNATIHPNVGQSRDCLKHRGKRGVVLVGIVLRTQPLISFTLPFTLGVAW